MLLAGAATLRPPATPGAHLLFSYLPSPNFKVYSTSFFSSACFPVLVDGGHSNRGVAVSTPMARVNGMVTGVAVDPENDEWLENKPAGFGEGKKYDTTVEDELMDEMERSRKALLVSINKKKNAAKIAERIKEQDPQVSSKATDLIPSGIRVRVWNLPRKKNIHRDLQLAFKGFRGILHISPAVIANQKTRDPICKGFAFLVLESEDAARRFVQTYTKQNMIFGKVQKQIMCDIVNPPRISADSSDEQLGDDTPSFSPPMSNNLRDATTSRSHSHHIPLDHRDNFPEGPSSGAIDVMTEQEYTWAMKDGDLIASHSEKTERGVEDLNGAVMNNHDRKQTTLKKKKIKAKSKSTAKLSTPGLTSRLKIRERTALTGAFSKYGAKRGMDIPNEK